MADKLTWSVVEDNGGGLHLYVFAPGPGERVVYAHCGFEHSRGALSKCIEALNSGETTRDWDGCEDDPQGSWDYWTEDMRRNGGYKIICDETGPIDTDKMGNAGRREFGNTTKKTYVLSIRSPIVDRYTDEPTGEWTEWSADASLFGSDEGCNEFGSMEEAQQAIVDLKNLGDDWSDCEYRVDIVDNRPLRDRVAEYERTEIRTALKDCSGDVRRAAKQLGLPERTLWGKIERLEIEPGEYRPGTDDGVGK